MAINVRTETIDIDSIKAHPKNPRLGDVAAIAESLEINGQYSPIVVWGDTIIAGTHTWRAAKSLGWKEIAVTYFEGSEDEALRVLVTDNRTSDIAVFNNEYLIDLLKSLPSLEGTGYEPSSIDQIEGLFANDSGGVSSEKLVDEGEEKTRNPIIKLGNAFVGELDPELFDIWLSSLKDAVGEKKAKVIKEIKDRLDLPAEAKMPKAKKEPVVKSNEPRLSMTDTELVPLSELKRFPGNAREGDIGAISESLRTLGQYRPIVVNKRNNQILKGNHTAAAASALGWKEIAVAWVDVDDESATRIVLADNRIAEKATYDNELLISVMNDLKTLEGTGFDGEDLIDLAKGKDTTPNQPKVKMQVGDYKFSTSESIFATWLEDTNLPDDAIYRLGLPIGALLREGN